MNREQANYLAGLFDADGCASKHFKRKKNYSYKVFNCEIAMTHKGVIDWVHKVVGFGNIYHIKIPKGLGKKPQWRWRVGHQMALNFAYSIIPYSIVKKDKLQEIIDFYVDKQKEKKEKQYNDFDSFDPDWSKSYKGKEELDSETQEYVDSLKEKI